MHFTSQSILINLSGAMKVMLSSGSWKDVRLAEGQVAVLAGYTLERATCGLVKAVKHRVVSFVLTSCSHSRNNVCAMLCAAQCAGFSRESVQGVV